MFTDIAKAMPGGRGAVEPPRKQGLGPMGSNGPGPHTLGAGEGERGRAVGTCNFY